MGPVFSFYDGFYSNQGHSIESQSSQDTQECVELEPKTRKYQIWLASTPRAYCIFFPCRLFIFEATRGVDVCRGDHWLISYYINDLGE